MKILALLQETLRLLARRMFSECYWCGGNGMRRLNVVWYAGEKVIDCDPLPPAWYHRRCLRDLHLARRGAR